MFRLVSDPLRCTGCRLCEVACSLKFEKKFGPGGSRIRVLSYPSHGIDIPIYCLHCEDAPCMARCPMDAIKRDEKTGVTFIDYNECTGCGKCANACPIGAIVYDPLEKGVFRCDLCSGKPKCVENCPTGTLVYTTPNKTAEERRKSILEIISSIEK